MKTGGSGTSRHRALATAETERQRLHDVLMASPAAIATVRGPGHVYELANPQYLRLLGHREVLGRPVREAVPELVVQGIVDLLDRVYASGEPFTGTEVPIQLDRRGDGTWEMMYFNIVYQPTRDAGGAVDGIVVHAVEVTDQVQARRRAEALAGAAETFARAELDLAALLNAIVHRVAAAIGDVGFLILLRPDGETLDLDALYSPDSEQQVRLQRLLGDAPLPAGEGIAGRVVDSGEAVRIAELDRGAHDAALPPALQAALGHVTIHSVLCVPLRTGGRVTGALALGRTRPAFPYTAEDQAFLQDLADRAALAVDNARLYEAERSARATAEAALATARQADAGRAAALRELAQREAEAASLRELARLKDEFLGTVSHELRTPLQVVYGYAELLELRLQTPGPRAGPEASVLAERIVASAGELTGMVDDLLDFARIERGGLTAHPADVDLVPVLRGAIAGLGERAGAESVVAELPAMLAAHADPKRVAQAVAHLLVNALTYAPDGQITLRAGPAPGNASAVRVEVEDSGPGILVAEQGRVWEKFYRGPAHLTDPTRGAGIGLAVVKALVEAQGGHVGLASAPGAGSLFWLELPIAPAPPA